MKNNPVKLTVIRASKYDLYMRKFQPRATLQYKVRDARCIKPVRSDFSLLKNFKIFRKLKTNKVKMQIPMYPFFPPYPL